MNENDEPENDHLRVFRVPANNRNYIYLPTGLVFCAGEDTALETPDGEKRVKDLKVDDYVAVTRAPLDFPSGKDAWTYDDGYIFGLTSISLSETPRMALSSSLGYTNVMVLGYTEHFTEEQVVNLKERFTKWGERYGISLEIQTPGNTNFLKIRIKNKFAPWLLFNYEINHFVMNNDACEVNILNTSRACREGFFDAYMEYLCEQEEDGAFKMIRRNDKNRLYRCLTAVASSLGYASWRVETIYHKKIHLKKYDTYFCKN